MTTKTEQTGDHMSQGRKRRGFVGALTIFIVSIVGIFVSAVLVAAVLGEGRDPMIWILSIFGAVIISIIIAAASVPSIRALRKQ